MRVFLFNVSSCVNKYRYAGRESYVLYSARCANVFREDNESLLENITIDSAAENSPFLTVLVLCYIFQPQKHPLDSKHNYPHSSLPSSSSSFSTNSQLTARVNQVLSNNNPLTLD